MARFLQVRDYIHQKHHERDSMSSYDISGNSSDDLMCNACISVSNDMI